MTDQNALTSSITELVEQTADLKGELVEFASGPRFKRQFEALLTEAAESDGQVDGAAMVRTMDYFILQHRLLNGQTVLDQFVTRRRPALSAVERETVLGWRDVVEGVFEVREFDNDAIVLHNLIDDLVYRTYSNMGPAAFTRARKGMFMVCRIVPVHPDTEAWLISGHISLHPKTRRQQIAKVVLETTMANPQLLRRNTDLVRKAWEQQAEDRAAFIEVFGADLAILPPEEAQERLREHYRRKQEAANSGRKKRKVSGPGAEQIGTLSGDILAAEDLGLIYDEVEGLNFYLDFGRLDALFADPTLVRDRTYLEQLRDYLEDDSVSPLAILRLVQRHPDGVDAIFGALLRKPGFLWSRDGEKLLYRKKKSFFDSEPTPSISVIGARLTELLGFDK